MSAMTKEELAAKLHGREYGHEITDEEAAAAKRAGLVVIFGASDDLVELRGAIEDEVGAYDGTTLLFADAALLTSECDNDACPHEERRANAARDKGLLVEAEYGGEGWKFLTDLPHATFDVMEDGDLFCRGIVLDLPGGTGESR